MNGLDQLVALVLVVLAIVGILIARRRTLAKMALRNISRKKRYAIIVVAGLLISTAMISGSLVVADTLDYIIKKDTLDSTGLVDEVVSVKDDAGEVIYFNESTAYNLIDLVDSGSLQYIDGAAPAAREWVTIINPSTNASAPSALLFGFDPSHTVNPLLRDDGAPVTSIDVSNGNAVINRKAADKLEAAAGDTVLILTETGVPAPVRISALAEDIGMARWNNANALFVDLDFVQSLYDENGKINSIDISNKGSVEGGYLVTDQAVAELEENLPQQYDYDFFSVKEDGIRAAKESSDQVSQVFFVMSSFAIIAGIALIINIFVMLAEERKPEMGVSRAVGMQRGDLTQNFMFEGLVYALLASAVGAFVGLIIATVMIRLFSAVFAGDVEWVLSFRWQSLAIAACAGFLITLLTVVIASWRVSKLNIVRAIRDIPEPMLVKSEKRYVVLGVLMIASGILLTASALATRSAATITLGPSLVALGMAMVAIRFFSARFPFSAAGAFMIYWMVDPGDLRDRLLGVYTGGMEMFIVSGLVLVTGGVLLTMFNSDSLLNGLLGVFGRSKSLVPVFKAAVSYPMNKKFRTGITLFIFSLIMFTVVVIAMIASFQRESVDTISQKYSGGFEIIGFSIRDIPRTNLSAGLEDLNRTLGPSVITRVEPVTTAPITIVPDTQNESVTSTFIGFDETLLLSGGFSLQKRAEEFETDTAVWNAVARNSSCVVMDGSVVPQIYGPQYGTFFVDIGDELTIVLQNGNQTNVTVIGIMDQVFLQGVFTSSYIVGTEAPVTHTNMFYVATSHDSPIPDENVAKELEKEFVEYGFMTYVIRDTVEEFMSMVSSIMQLMEVFLGIGLVVGITGLGIITIRNVTERRQEIGVMRAIGYQRRMILQVFLLETSFVALLGITLGVVLGLVLSWRLYDWGGFSENAPFVVPWGEVITLTVVAFLITVASTLAPSRKASKLAPAEALRRID